MAKHKAKKKFGQNFLTDGLVINRIISAINPANEDVFLEIGPGLGALSTSLIEAANKLFVVEIDKDLIPKINRIFSNFPQEKWQVFNQDALTFSLKSIYENVDESSASKQIRVTGNLPYNISTPLMFHFLTQVKHVKDMHFMLQKEVVERICAAPDCKDYGRLSIMLQYYCDCEHLFDVPPESFDPAPKVDSAIVRLTPYETLPYPCQDTEQLSRLVNQAFSQRRKTLRNNFKKLNIETAMEEAEINGQLRAENINLAQYVRLCNILSRQNISI
jgi:16S rRNA (adenine1518-N6/adenine1519-N6)-dimethyltransferase